MSDERHMYMIWYRLEDTVRLDEVLKSIRKKNLGLVIHNSKAMCRRIGLTTEEATFIQLSMNVLDLYRNSRLRKISKIPKHVLEGLEK